MKERAETVYVKQEKVEEYKMERGVRRQRDRQYKRQKNMQLPADCSLHLLYITGHTKPFYKPMLPFCKRGKKGTIPHLMKCSQM